MTAATDLSNAIRLALSNEGHFICRANVGKFKMQDGRWFDTGLPVGFSDLFGNRAGDAKAFYIEVKAGRDTVKPHQEAFLAAMRARGAIAGVARSVQDAKDLLRNSHQKV
jgi:VRR-NUC domain